MGEIKKEGIEGYIDRLEESLLAGKATERFVHEFTPEEIIRIDRLSAFHERIELDNKGSV